MAKEVFFIADDFGLSAETNEAILRSHLEGVLHGTCLMMGQPGSEEAVMLAKHYPGMTIGWHLHLNDSIPMTVPAWPWGESSTQAGFAIGLDPKARRLAREEIRVQWEAYRATGLRCDFITTHHHLHVHPMILPRVVETVGVGFTGWLRLGQPCFFKSPAATAALRPVMHLERWRAGRSCKWKISDTIWGIDRTFCMETDEVRAALGKLGEGHHEFIFHPRVADPAKDRDFKTLLELKREGC
jgi:predicted glycoside hydrolase/deacetylase ChbG (UPF0249 family)